MKRAFIVGFVVLFIAAVAVLIWSESVDRRAAELLERTNYVGFFRVEYTFKGVTDYEETEKGDLIIYYKKHKIRFSRRKDQDYFDYFIIEEGSK